MGDKQRISYLPLEAMDDEMRAEMDRCRITWRLDTDAAFWEPGRRRVYQVILARLCQSKADSSRPP